MVDKETVSETSEFYSAQTRMASVVQGQHDKTQVLD
jgi:hypothetical protein